MISYDPYMEKDSVFMERTNCTCTIDGSSKCAYHTTAVPISALDESMLLSINTRSVYRKTESNSIPAFTIMVAKKCDPPNAQL